RFHQSSISRPWTGAVSAATLISEQGYTANEGDTMSRDSTHRPGFPRRSLAVPAALMALAAGAAGHPAAAMSAAPAPYHQPPWLGAPGRAVTLAYALLDPSVTGAVYVRNELRRTFTRLTLTPGPYCP